MKKEVHRKLLKRLCAACFGAAVIILAAVFFFESARIEQDVVSNGVKEASIYSSLFSDYLKNPDSDNQAELKVKATDALEQNSYLHMEFLAPDKKLIDHVSTTQGSKINQLFVNKGLIMVPSGTASGTRIISNKRIYLRISTPVVQPGTTTIIGYLNGIYQVTMADTKAVINRFILSVSFALGGTIICGVFCYLGFLLLNNRIIRSIGELSKTNTFLLKKLGAALAKSDTLNTEHSPRILIFSVKLAEKTSLPRNQIRSLIVAGFLHDLGMLAIDHELLHKKETWPVEEHKKVYPHPKDGAENIKRLKWLNSAVPIIEQHHEKYNGGGYPAGLKHEKINTPARIFAIADAFDALTSKRPYREAYPLEEALDLMDRESGLHFDPVLLASFVEIAPELHRRTKALSIEDLDRELNRLLSKYLKV